MNIFQSGSIKSYINTVSNCNLNITSEYKKHIFSLFLSILKQKNFEDKICLFAGSSIGLIRNAKSVPWVDDYDIIIMEEDFELFMNEIMPMLNKNFFYGLPSLENLGMYHIFYRSSLENNNFQLDIFISYIHKNNLFNISNAGTYSGKLSKDIVFPFKKRHFDNEYINFFNNVEQEVKICYGEVLNQSKIHIEHGKTVITFDEHFEKTYETFYKNVEESEINTKKILEIHQYQNIIKLDANSHYNNYTELFLFLCENNAKKIINTNNKNLYFFPEIKFLLPNIEITHLLINEDGFISPELFNYCDKVKFKSITDVEYFQNTYSFFNKKLIFGVINVITFGTFDLLHNGHINIFFNCRKYSNNIIAGVSSDKLNEKKGKKSIQNENERIKNIADLKHIKSIFLEESLEEKNNYIHTHDADILIMGDDWKDKFNWVDCISIYIPRTLHISSSELRVTSLKKDHIAHGGGSIENYLYSNSYESVVYNKGLFNYIELDIVKLADSYGIAHDQTEKSIYNTDIKFSDMTLEIFNKLLAYKRFTILTFEKLNEILTNNNDLNIVFDWKFDTNELGNFINFIKSKISNINQIFFQVYNLDDCKICNDLTIKNVLFAMWKQYDGKFDDLCVTSIIDYCIINLNLLGIGISHAHKNNFDVNQLTRNNKTRIFYHKPSMIVSKIDTENYFIDDYIDNAMIKLFRLNPDFDVIYYKNRYQDLQEEFCDNESHYYYHYLYYGHTEDRECSDKNIYNILNIVFNCFLPKNFDLETYKLHSDLHKAFGEDNSKYIYHFLTYGFYEPHRKYITRIV